MELRHLRYFLALAETLHFGRAAKQLNIVQPALSMQIKALEEELGVALFQRDRKSVVLTEAGRLFQIEAKKTLMQAEITANVARMAGRGMLGRVRLGYAPSAIYSGLLAAAIRLYRKDYPQTELTMDEVHPHSQYERLRSHNIDVAFGTTLSFPLTEEFIGITLTAFPLKMALPQGHQLAGLDMIDPYLLRNETFIGHTGPSDEEGFFLTRHVLKFEPKVGYRASSPLMALGMVEAGLGVVMVSSILAQTHKSGIVYRDLSGVTDQMDVTMICRREENEPVVTGFVQTVRRLLI